MACYVLGQHSIQLVYMYYNYYSIIIHYYYHHHYYIHCYLIYRWQVCKLYIYELKDWHRLNWTPWSNPMFSLIPLLLSSIMPGRCQFSPVSCNESPVKSWPDLVNISKQTSLLFFSLFFLLNNGDFPRRRRGKHLRSPPLRQNQTGPPPCRGLFREIASPAILCHKEPARASKAPY